MKKLMYILIIIMMFLITHTQFVYAAISTDILSDDFVDEFKIDGDEDEGVSKMVDSVLDRVKPIINKVLTIIQVFGVILTIISVAFFGFSIIMTNGSEFLGPLAIKGGLMRGGKKTPSDQKQLRQWMWVVLIGAILLFMGSTIVKIVFNILKV